MIKKLLFFLLIPFYGFGQLCSDEDTVLLQRATTVGYTTATLTGTPGGSAGVSWAVKYVRTGQTDTITTSFTASITKNLTGLYSGVQYKFRYLTFCGSTTQGNLGYGSFNTTTTEVQYTPMTAPGYQFKYLKADSGIAMPIRDTSTGRGTTRPGPFVINSADSMPYFWNGVYWKPFALDSAGLQAQINLKVDSVTVSGDSLFYWKVGVSYGYILPALANTWRTVGNAGTSSSTNFIGTTDYVDLILKAGGTQLMKLYGDGLGKVSIGLGNVVTGDFAKSFGNSDTASGEYATTFGVRSNAVGANSFAAGENTFANGILSVAFGVDTRVDAQIGFGMGETNILKSYGGTVFGTFNDTTDTGNPNSISSTNRLFQIGNGTADISRSNALTVLSNGNFGFGVLSPSATIEIKAGSSSISPIKFNSGNPTTLPAAGQLQYKTGLLILDSSSSVRDTLATRSWVRNNISSGSTSLSIGSTVTSATAGSVFFAGTGGILQQKNSDFFYDSTNKRLGIGTSSPATTIHATASGAVAKFVSTGYVQNTVEISDPDGYTYITNGQFKVGSVPFVINANGSYITYQTGGVDRMRIAYSGNVGIGTTSPNTAAILDLTSTTQGLLLPRMTKTQRDAISSPVAGLAIYQTDNTPGLRVYNGTNWMRFTETTD